MNILKRNKSLFNKNITSLLLSLSLFCLSSATGLDKCRQSFSPPSFPSYKEASLITQSLGINYPQEFLSLKKAINDPRLQNIPPDPDLFYANKGWTNWFDFLGSKPPVSNLLRLLPTPRYTDHVTASLIVQRLSLKNKQMFEYLKEKEDPSLQYIPSDPEDYYQDSGWTNWTNFLGTEQPDHLFKRMD